MNVPDTGQKKNKIFLIYLLVAMSRPRHVVSGQLGPARWACGQPRMKDVRLPRCSQCVKCERVGRSVCR